MTPHWSRPTGLLDCGRQEAGPQPATAPFATVIGRLHSAVVVTVQGTLDTLAATRLAATLRDLIDGQGNLTIALDLRQLEDVAPSGLQVLSVAAAITGATFSSQGKEYSSAQTCVGATWPRIPANCLDGGKRREVRPVGADVDAFDEEADAEAQENRADLEMRFAADFN